MKKWGLVVIVLAVVGAASSPWWPASIGAEVYATAGALEASMAGLDKTQVSVQGKQVTVYVSPFENRPTLLLLHGFSADKTVWSRFARHFKDDYNLIVPDLPGFGETGYQPEWHYDAFTQAATSLALLDALGIEQAHVMGNSMGGFIAAVMALEYPERVQSIVLVDPAGVESPQPSSMDDMLAEGKNPFLQHSRADFDHFFSIVMAEPPWFPEVALKAVAEQYQARRDALAHMFSEFHGQRLLDARLSEIRSPTLILWGAQDGIIHVSSAKVWHAGITNSELEVWPTIGHMPMMEIPAESAGRVQQFLTSIE